MTNLGGGATDWGLHQLGCDQSWCKLHNYIHHQKETEKTVRFFWPQSQHKKCLSKGISFNMLQPRIVSIVSLLLPIPYFTAQYHATKTIKYNISDCGLVPLTQFLYNSQLYMVSMISSDIVRPSFLHHHHHIFIRMIWISEYMNMNEYLHHSFCFSARKHFTTNQT